MEYDSPLFNAAVKKILRSLAGETDKDKAAVQEYADAQIKEAAPTPVVHELHVSDATVDRIKSQAPEEKRREKFKDRLETITIGAVILYTILAGFQWYELNTQNLNQSAANIDSGATADKSLREIQKNGADTHELALRTKDLADRALAQAKATYRLAEQAKRSADANKVTAEAAKTSADISQRQVRAYVTLSLAGNGNAPILRNDPKLKAILATLIFRNSGQSIASDVVTESGNFIAAWNPKAGENCKQVRRLQVSDANPSRSILAPQGQIQVTVAQDAKFWDAIEQGTYTVCAFGSVFYVDVFGMAHETEYCIFWLNGGSWADCATHNQAYDYPKGASPYPSEH